jgi:hypothetical protein
MCPATSRAFPALAPKREDLSIGEPLRVMVLALALRCAVGAELLSEHPQIDGHGMPHPVSEFGCAGISQATQ